MDEQTLSTIGTVVFIVFVAPLLWNAWYRSRAGKRSDYYSDVWGMKWALRLRGHWRGSKAEAMRRVGPKP